LGEYPFALSAAASAAVEGFHQAYLPFRFKICVPCAGIEGLKPRCLFMRVLRGSCLFVNHNLKEARANPIYQGENSASIEAIEEKWN